MLFNELVRQVNVPLALVPSSQPDREARPARRQRRDFVILVSAIAALCHAGCVVELSFTDDQGARVPEEQVPALVEVVEAAIRELAPGRAAHARRTIAELGASRKSDAEQVDDLLNVVYEEHARGARSRDVLATFLDRFERWLTPDAVARVDLLFGRVDLDRAPESLGILLLATTRLTRTHFEHREPYIDRLRRWLIGRSERTEQDVDNMLRGLRE